MKISIEYTLPEEQDSFHYAHHGSEAFSLLLHLNNQIRDYLKYTVYTEETHEKLLEDVNKEINTFLTEAGVV
jgi:hypothetical protein